MELIEEKLKKKSISLSFNLVGNRSLCSVLFCGTNYRLLQITKNTKHSAFHAVYVS